MAQLPCLKSPAFGVWLGSVSLTPPSPSSALPPALIQNASPKAISGRTSYLQVRLAFHLYTQVIPQFCNIGGFGPPVSVTSLSPCPCVAHSGFVSNACHCAILRLLRPIQTRFRFASGCLCLKLATDINSLAHSPKGTPSEDCSPSDRL